MKKSRNALMDGGTRVRWMGGAAMFMLTLLAGQARVTDALAGGSLEMPLPPPSHVLDAGDVFARNPEKLVEISKGLKQLEKKHGVQVYLVVYSGLLRTSVAGQAKDLCDLWIGEETDGIVVVCNTDDARVALGRPRATFHSTEDEPLRMTRLPDSRIVPIIRELKREIDRDADPADFVSQVAGILTTRLDELLSVEPTGWRDGSAWIVGVATVVVVVLLGALGFWISRSMQHAEEKARERFYFPEVLVRSRLGANCGGGKTAVVHYAAAGETPPTTDSDEKP